MDWQGVGFLSWLVVFLLGWYGPGEVAVTVRATTVSLIRQVRSTGTLLFILVWLLYRCFPRFIRGLVSLWIGWIPLPARFFQDSDATNLSDFWNRVVLNNSSGDQSVLELAWYQLSMIKTYLQDWSSGAALELLEITDWKHWLARRWTAYMIVPKMILCIWRLAEDVLGFLLLLSLYRILYCLTHYSLAEWKDLVFHYVFYWAIDHVLPMRRALEQQVDETFSGSSSSSPSGEDILRKDPNRILTCSIPTLGRPHDSILQELQRYSLQEDQKWQDGKVSGTVYMDDAKHSELMHSVFALYTWGNPLHPGFWPKLNQCEAEVICMTANLLHNPQNIGCVTSGGTESIILSVRAHLQYYGHRRRIAHPEIVCGSTAHAALFKACEMFGIRPVVVDCNDGETYQLNPTLVQRHITINTIMIYASAPCYPQGVVDPIPALSELAYAFDIGLHVDACLGGFVLPFLDQEYDEIAAFDFRNRGVTSMSADTHKYGYAAKGTSVVLYRSKELRQEQYFCYPHWTGGMYSTPTIAGSRPGALSVCAWAALVSVGQEGYQERVRRIVQAARDMATGIQQIDGLKLMTPKPSMIVCFGAATVSSEKEDPGGVQGEASNAIDIYRVSDFMTERGWSLNSLQAPASIHVCVTLNMVNKVGVFLEDLGAAVQQVRNEGDAGRSRGSAGIYGAVGSLPDGPVEFLLKAFTDLTLEP